MIKIELKDLNKINEKERWKYIIIDDKKTNYAISTEARVYSFKSNKILKPEKSNSGYYRVGLYFNGLYKHKSLHRLVAIAFLPNPENKPEVNHKDGDKSHNRVSNLEWTTSSENDYHAYKTGLKKSKVGNESHLAKYDIEDIKQACEMMEDGLFTLPEISKVTKIHIAMLYLIKKRRSWTNISQSYDVENCLETKEKYNEDQIEKVFSMLEEDKLSIYEISDITKVKSSTIYNIIIGRYKSHKYLYDIYDVEKFHRRKNLPNISDDAKKEIENMILEGKTNKAISKYISEKYNYNIDRVRHTIYRIKKKLK